MADSHGTLGNIILQGQAITSVFLVDWLWQIPCSPIWHWPYYAEEDDSEFFCFHLRSAVTTDMQPPGKTTSGLSQFIQTNPATYERELHMSTKRLGLL